MPYLPSISAKIAMTTIGVALPSVIYVIGSAVVSEITPTAQLGELLAIGTAVATSAGLLPPYVIGSVAENAATALEAFTTGFILWPRYADRRGISGGRRSDPSARRHAGRKQVSVGS